MLFDPVRAPPCVGVACRNELAADRGCDGMRKGNTMKNSMALVLMAGALVGVMGCEEKKPETTPASTTSAPATKPVEAVKDAGAKAIEGAKDAGAKAVEGAKDAGAKAVESVKDAGAKAAEGAKEAAKGAAAAISDEVKKSVNDYTKSLGNFEGLLEGVKSPLDAAGKLGALKTETGLLASAYAALDKLSPEIKSTIKTTFKDQLEPLTKKVNDQIARISADKGLGSTLGELLKSVKLF